MVETSQAEGAATLQEQISKHLAEQFNVTLIKHDFFLSAIPQKNQNNKASSIDKKTVLNIVYNTPIEEVRLGLVYLL